MPMVPPLKKLPLAALTGNAGQTDGQQTNAGIPAPILRSTVRLAFVTRHQAAKIAPLELQLIKTWRRLTKHKGALPTLLLWLCDCDDINACIRRSGSAARAAACAAADSPSPHPHTPQCPATPRFVCRHRGRRSLRQWLSSCRAAAAQHPARRLRAVCQQRRVPPGAGGRVL